MAEKNERTKIIIGIVLIVGIIVLSYVLFPAGRRSTAPPAEQSPLELAPTSIQAEAQTFEQEDNLYAIKVQYPQITGMEDDLKQGAVNREIEQHILGTSDDFKKRTEDVETFGETKHGFYVDYFVSFWSDSLVSIKFTVSEYVSGAAHPNNYTLVFNYDIAQDKEIALKDLFLPEIDYLTILSDLTRTALLERFEEDLEAIQDWIERGTEAKQENFQNFVFTDEALTICFDPYQIGPYALGIQIIEIPFEDLEGYINPRQLGL